METKVIRDSSLKDKILGEVKSEIARFKEMYDQSPGIAFIGFMGVPLGKYNIPFHLKLASDLGFTVYNETQADDISEEDLFHKIDELNANENIHAIVLLQPLPTHLVPVRIVNRIDPAKEVEGFHPLNMMKNLMPDIAEAIKPMCLPTALIELFEANNIKAEKDEEWVLLLDDEFFDNQLVNMVTRTAFTKAVPKNCILTIVNRNSVKLTEKCKLADFLVVVTKEPGYVNADLIKPGVCIIDIYSNLVKEIESKKNPGQIVPIIRGGVDIESVMGKAGCIFPIPGGLMTIVLSILFRNVLISFKNNIKVV